MSDLTRRLGRGFNATAPAAASLPSAHPVPSAGLEGWVGCRTNKHGRLTAASATGRGPRGRAGVLSFPGELGTGVTGSHRASRRFPAMLQDSAARLFLP